MTTPPSWPSSAAGDAVISDIGRLGRVCALSVAVGTVSWMVASAVSRDDGRPTVTEIEPSMVTAAVERRTVVRSVSGRATVGFTDLIDVDAPVSGGRITTEPRAEGDPVQEGDVLFEIDGRPIVALAGATPMYRSLTVGTSGPDVLQFEEALARMGVDTGPVDGTFDSATEAAVRAFTRRLGYEVSEPTAEQRAAHDAARDAVTQGELRLLNDRHALDRDRAGPDPAQRAEMDSMVATAEESLAKARRDRAALDGDLAREMAAASDGVSRARTAADRARRDLAALPADAPRVERTALVDLVEETGAGLTEAQRAEQQVVQGRRGRVAEADAAVAAGERGLEAAILGRRDALRSPERDLLIETVRVSEQSLDDARRRLTDQAAIMAAGVAPHEIVFVPDLPRRVQAVLSQRGDVASGPVMRLAGGDPLGRWFASSAEVDLLSVGMPVRLAQAGAATAYEGSILRIATEPGDPAASQDGGAGPGSPAPGAGSLQSGYLVEVALTAAADGSPVRSLLGRDLQVTVPVEESDGPSLVVPLAALAAAPDGSTSVLVTTGQDVTRPVPVEVGLVGDGSAEVRALTAGDLAEGDRVVVGG